ncbi:MAG TPA: hypothetical protein VK645_17570 [Chitinophagaceae bacterium]|nr:hypothetical protein [Chitinophagaceae bacterium]
MLLVIQSFMEKSIILADTVLENGEVADMLQNDISQTLAAVLLWLQTAMDEEQLAANLHLQLAESNLKSSIKKLVRLHYALLQ